jgi:hypothetical protein
MGGVVKRDLAALASLLDRIETVDARLNAIEQSASDNDLASIIGRIESLNQRLLAIEDAGTRRRPSIVVDNSPQIDFAARHFQCERDLEIRAGMKRHSQRLATLEQDAAQRRDNNNVAGLTHAAVSRMHREVVDFNSRLDKCAVAFTGLSNRLKLLEGDNNDRQQASLPADGCPDTANS